MAKRPRVGPSLIREADRVSAVDAEIAALRERPPNDPTLRALFEKLLAAREQARLAAPPRLGDELSGEQLAIHEDPPVLAWQAADRALAPAVPWWPSFGQVHAEIALLGWSRRPIEPACDCPGASAGCAHMVNVLDVALRFLSRGEAATLAKLGQLLAVPEWRRALRDLDGRLPRAPARREGEVERLLSWRLGRCDGTPPAIEAVVHKRLKKGGWSSGAAMPLHQLSDTPELLSHPKDAEVLELLGELELFSIADRRQAQKRFAALEALAGHPRVLSVLHGAAPVRVVRARFEIVCRELAGGEIELLPTLDGDPATAEWFYEELQGECFAHLDPATLVCRTARVPVEARALVDVVCKRGALFPPESHGELLLRLPRIEKKVPVALPPALAGERIEPSRTPVVRLRPDDRGGVALAVQVRPLPGGPLYDPGAGGARLAGLRALPEGAAPGAAAAGHSPPGGGRRVFADRDLRAEVAEAEVLLASLPLPPAEDDRRWEREVADADAALDLLAALRPLHEAGRLALEWYEEQRALRVTRPATAASLRVRVEDRRDWFGLAGSLEVDGETVELAALLDAVRGGGRYVPVGPGRFVALSDELRRKLLRAAEVAYEGRSGLEVAPAAADALADLLEDAGERACCERWQALQARLTTAQALDPEPPAPIASALRPYQREGFRWLSRLAAWGVGACLADDMGLGKTLQALALLTARAERGPALVIAPTSVCGNWVREAARFAPGLRTVLYREADREGVFAALGASDVLIASYALVARHGDRFAGTRFATLVLDEAQAVKNAATRRARAVRELETDFRVALTGTPVENHLGELWSLFRILSPGLLGSWEQFRERFANPIERWRDGARREALARVIRPFVLRRTKAAVAPELPSRTEAVLPVRLSLEERRLYDAARLSAVARLARRKEAGGGEKLRFEILAEITRLRQLACHPRLVDPASRAGSAKLDRFLEAVETLREEGHRALVFSQFVKHLALVRAALGARGISYRYLDGATPAAQREAEVDAFQRGEGDLFLVSLKAGGTGLNLTAADYVIHLDPWWNPAVEDQATDRAHRIGQEKPVTVYRLVAQGTIEEEILALHAQKRDLVEGLLAGADTAARLSTEDLLALVRGGGGRPADVDLEEDEPSEEA